MRWKKFFKPDKTKIIFAIILFFLLPVSYTVPMLGGPKECSGLQTCELGTKTFFAEFGGLIFIFSLFAGGNQPFESLIDYLWKIPYLIILSYLLSCSIIFLIRKFQNK